MYFNTKTVEYRATRHEIKNFLYQTIDLFKPRRLKYARESERPKKGVKAKQRETFVFRIFSQFYAPKGNFDFRIFVDLI